MTRDQLVLQLKAVAEPTRLRILSLLAACDLSVGELARALKQQQPRVSWHLKLLADCGLVERRAEGAWAFYRIADAQAGAPSIWPMVRVHLDQPDAQMRKDQEALDQIRAERLAAAESYFRTNATDWDRIGGLHLPDTDIDAAMRAAVGNGHFEMHVDIGVGTGRMIRAFADQCDHQEGIDSNREMLNVARARLADMNPTRIGLRLGDAYGLGLDDACADLVTLHQVIHFLDDPARALREAARLLRPSGVLAIADFAPHGLEALREQHAHRRLGFSREEVSQWCMQAGLTMRSVNDLAPGSGQGLTVTIWVAQAPLARPELDPATPQPRNRT